MNTSLSGTRKSALKIAIVIVNYRTPDLVTGCLDSLLVERSPDLPFQVFIGDADSGDGSVQTISDYIAQQGLDWALCYDIGRNGGFAYGNNAVIEKHVWPDADFTHVYFLNPDTYVRPDAIKALAGFLQTHPEAGVVGSRLENPDGSGRAYGFRKPAPWREFFRGARTGFLTKLFPQSTVMIPDLDTDTKVDWVTGASFMMPRTVLEEVGLMDDRYFLYFEETDLMTRVRAAGYSVWHVAASRVVHLAGQSTGVRTQHTDAPEPMARLSPFWLQSRQRFFQSHYGQVRTMLATGLFLLGDLFYRGKQILGRRAIDNPPHLWRDYLRAGRQKP